MKSFIMPLCAVMLLLAACTSGTASESGEPAVPSERDELVTMFKENTQAFRTAISGLSEAQWNFRETDDRWSIGEIAEHIIIAEKMFSGALKDMVLAGEPNASLADSVKVTDKEVSGAMADRTHAFNAPPEAVPQGAYATPVEALSAFDKARAGTMDLLKSDKDLRKYFGPHPAFGTLDAYQWFLFSVSHANRHLKQVEQVKADANYPS